MYYVVVEGGKGRIVLCLVVVEMKATPLLLLNYSMTSS